MANWDFTSATANARRIPMTSRVQAILDMRVSKANRRGWVFPAQTKSGHIEPSTLKKEHLTAIAEVTGILREATGDANPVAPHMDPWTLAYLAGHREGRGNCCTQLTCRGLNGAPGVIRTPDLLVRSQTLYPTELRAREEGINSTILT
jgi:hypothetical protein